MTVGPLHGPGPRPGDRLPVDAAGRDLLAVRTITLPTAADTQAFGATLAGVLRRGDLIVLSGPLGAGLGVDGRVASPTFVIARVHAAGHPDGLPLVHVDAYRLTSLDEVDDLDLDVDVAGVVTVVEWGAGLVEQLADARLVIELERAAESDAESDSESEVRTATLRPFGGDWAQRLADLERHLD